jgi:probable phosphoglycerate mutase
MLPCATARPPKPDAAAARHRGAPRTRHARPLLATRPASAADDAYSWTGADEFDALGDRHDLPPLPLPTVAAEKRVTLVRHGQSTWNAAGRIQGSSNLSKLTEKGIQQARTTQAVLRADAFDALYYSPLERARHTAEIVWGARQGPQEAVPGLREIDLYDFQVRCSSWAARCCGAARAAAQQWRPPTEQPAVGQRRMPQAINLPPQQQGADARPGRPCRPAEPGQRRASSARRTQGLIKSEGKQRYGDQYRLWQAAPAHFQLGSRAPVRELWHRASLVWRQLLAGPERQAELLVVAHNAANQALICTALGLPPSHFRRVAQGNGAASQLHFAPGPAGTVVTLRKVNQSPGLPFEADGAPAPGGKVGAARPSPLPGRRGRVLLAARHGPAPCQQPWEAAV